jgi:hypothetical protein
MSVIYSELKLGDALSSDLFKYILDCAIKKVKRIRNDWNLLASYQIHSAGMQIMFFIR